jgi:hypothetical protein
MNDYNRIVDAVRNRTTEWIPLYLINGDDVDIHKYFRNRGCPKTVCV